jgi:hypothetical protein
MSLTMEAYTERKWGPFPALRKVLEHKQLPAKYFPTSVSDNLLDSLGRLTEIALLASEFRDELMEATKDDFYRAILEDLEHLGSALEWAKRFFNDQISTIKDMRHTAERQAMMLREEAAKKVEDENVASNPFIDIVRTAHVLKWCTMPSCSTCYAHDYLQALKQLRGESGGDGLAKALAALSPSELTKQHEWKNALWIAIRNMTTPLQLRAIVKAWIPKFYGNLYFSDIVLYKIIRYLPKGDAIRKEWTDKCILLAKDTKDFSLVESLLLVLRKASFEHPELIEIAKEHAKSSSQMRRVLRNACGIELKMAYVGSAANS